MATNTTNTNDGILSPPTTERKTPLLLHSQRPPRRRILPNNDPPSPSTPRTTNVAVTQAHPSTALLLLPPVSSQQPNTQTDEIPSTPLAPWQSAYLRCCSSCTSNNNNNSTSSVGLVYFGAFFITAASLVYGFVSSQVSWSQARIDWDTTYQVAFIGNSYLFVNDIPRLLEALSSGHVYQNSCLHPGGSLSDIWITGNGMYSLWQSDTAVMELYDGTTTYDYGLCTVAQLLQGYDEYIGYGNSAGHYYDDGLNPCIVNPYYASVMEDQLQHDPVQWDYVVLVDQTKRMAIPAARNDSIQVLTNGYAPFLQQSGAIPVLIDTHAFWSDASNMTGLTDIPTFTRYIVQGVQEYTKALRNVLPKAQAPLVAPIGLAYLVVWEEHYDLWTQLFLDNMIHASLYGSYLLGVVLYCTLFGHAPPDDVYVPFLFEDARYVMHNNDNNNNNNNALHYLDADNLQYLRSVAKRVVLQRHVPDALYE